jgi:hypothetical protein
MGSETKDQNVPVGTVNRRVIDLLDREDTTKVAQAATEYTRTQLREDSFAMKILPPEKATNDMLDRDLDERLRIIEELEPDSPGAKWVPFQDVPEGEYIYGSRYAIPFARIITPKFQKDIDELRTYKQDIRKILTQNSIKDGLAEYDGKFIETCEAIAEDTTTGTVNNPQAFTGKSQWIELSGGMTKDNLVEAFKMLPTGNASGKFRMRNHVMLMNESTAQDLKKLDADEIGDSNVADIWTNGLQTDRTMGLKAIFTIKDDLVPDQRVWFFPEPGFLGKAYYLHDWTMFVEKRAYFVEMFSYWLGGMGIGNIAGVCCADFNGVVTP